MTISHVYTRTPAWDRLAGESQPHRLFTFACRCGAWFHSYNERDPAPRPFAMPHRLSWQNPRKGCGPKP